jgi:hypothetical protein
MPNPTHSFARACGLFIADIHLGRRQYNKLEREEDYQRALITCVDEALALPGCRFVGILGDTCDVDHENHPILAFIVAQVRRLTSAGIIVYYLNGNHDKQQPTLPTALGLPGFLDAEACYLDCLRRGVPFQPYGEDGPRVAAFNYHEPTALCRAMEQARAAENADQISTELWLHQSITPGAPLIGADFDLEVFGAAGWHTVIAGDIHSGGRWTKQTAAGLTTLYYPGSPEMTEFGESEARPRGFIVHTPLDSEPMTAPAAFKVIPYAYRPYHTFTFDGPRTEEQVAQVLSYLADLQFKRPGQLPIIRIVTSDPEWRTERTIRQKTLCLFIVRPEIAKLELVPTAPAELQPDGTIGGGNAARYGTPGDKRTLHQKLAAILDRSNADEPTRAFGRIVLAHPTNPELWAATTS